MGSNENQRETDPDNKPEPRGICKLGHQEDVLIKEVFEHVQTAGLPQHTMVVMVASSFLDQALNKDLRASPKRGGFLWKAGNPTLVPLDPLGFLGFFWFPLVSLVSLGFLGFCRFPWLPSCALAFWEVRASRSTCQV